MFTRKLVTNKFYLSKFVVGQVQESEMVLLTGIIRHLNILDVIVSKI
jgi:hypothetical protein